jgi:hypothetical protein
MISRVAADEFLTEIFSDAAKSDVLTGVDTLSAAADWKFEPLVFEELRRTTGQSIMPNSAAVEASTGCIWVGRYPIFVKIRKSIAAPIRAVLNGSFDR